LFSRPTTPDADGLGLGGKPDPEGGELGVEIGDREIVGTGEGRLVPVGLGVGRRLARGLGRVKSGGEGSAVGATVGIGATGKDGLGITASCVIGAPAAWTSRRPWVPTKVVETRYVTTVSSRLISTSLTIRFTRPWAVIGLPSWAVGYWVCMGVI
jgi:hypothetical protein